MNRDKTAPEPPLSVVRMFTPSMDFAHPEDEVHLASIENFNRLDAKLRKRCIDRLLVALRKPESRNALVVWAYELGKGLALGSDDPRFHLSLGMQIRNWLRGEVSDTDLLPVCQPSGDYATNWDDYYYGALKAAVVKEILDGDE